QLGDAGIETMTMHRLLGGLDRGWITLDASDVVIIDEAGLIGTRQLDRLVNYTTTARAKLVLVGDYHQLREIDAGGAVRALAHRLGAVELTENRRQRHGWEIKALGAIRANDVASAMRLYEQHQRVHHATTADDYCRSLIDAWRQEYSHREVLMFAFTRADTAM